MAGHSKWANIRHRKGAADAKKNKIFTKIMREIVIAVKEGGSGDIEANPRLRSAILKARIENMPKDNIEKAVKKGLGENEGADYSEILYEGYAHGVALLINVLTDNKNRSASDVRSLLTKSGASLGTSGSASRLFEKKGLIYLPASLGEDNVLEVALEAGAEDVQADEEAIQVTTEPKDFTDVLEAFQAKEWEIIQASVQSVPMMRESLSQSQAQKVLALIDKLEDLDDVQSVDHNLEIPDDEE